MNKLHESDEVEDGLTGKDILLILLIACVIRMIHWVSLQESVFFAYPQLDERYYVQFAQAIAGGENLREFGGFRPMLYPLFIALFLKLDPLGGLVTTLMVQHVLGILTTLGVALLAAAIGQSRRAGWIAGILFAGAGPPVFFEGQFLIVTLFTFLVVYAFVFLLAGMRSQHDIRQWVYFGLSGGLAGLSVQARPNAIVFLFVFILCGLFAVFKQDLAKRSTGYLYALVAFTLVLLGFGYLNQLQSGRFQILTSAGGINLYAGNGPGADGTTPRQGFSVTYEGSYKDSMQVFAEQAYRQEHPEKREVSTEEISSYWVKQTLKHIRSSPFEWMGLMLRKVGFFVWNEELPNNKSYRFFSQYETPALHYFPVRWCILLGLGLPGICMMVFRARPGAFPVLLFVVFYTGIVLLFFVNARFRIPIWPFFAVGAGVWVSETLMTSRRMKKWRLMVSVGIGLLSCLNLTGFAVPDFSRDFYFQSKARLTKGQVVPALESIEASLALDAENPDAKMQKGNVLFAAGKFDDAIEMYRVIVDQEPEETRGWNNLGAALDAVGQSDKAYEAYRRAVELDPRHENALVNLLMLTIRGDRLEEAEQWLEKAQAVNHSRLDIQIAGAILLRPVQPDEADQIMTRSLKFHPEATKQILETLRQPANLSMPER